MAFIWPSRTSKLRGPGDILGTRQSGEQSFKIADLGEHAHLMPRVITRSEALLRAPQDSDDHAYLLGLLNTWAASRQRASVGLSRRLRL